MLAGAVGVPYLWYETDIGSTGRQVWNSATSGAAATDPSGAASNSWTGLNPTGLRGDAAGNGWAGNSGVQGLPASMVNGLNGPVQQTARIDPFRPTARLNDQTPIVSLAEILRFDVTPEWVMSRFPRVTTLLSDMNLDGLRVPLITGSSPVDMAGTLTYYFDRYKRLKRLTVHASVGDPTRFIMELQQAYHLSQEPALGGNLYVTKWNGQVTSLLHVSPASVIYNDLPYARYNLFLELNQADLEYGLSVEGRQLVEAGKQMRRW